MIQINVEWDKVPDEGDLLECLSWARLEWTAGRYNFTRVYDRETRSERRAIYVPQYAIANWIVANWWSLLYEPWPFDEVLPNPASETRPEVLEWLHRHCLRAANPGHAGPFACIFSQGRDRIAIVSRRDASEAYPQMRIEFLEEAEHTDSREALQDALSEYVGRVLGRVEGFADDRVVALSEEWQALRGLSSEEEVFCRAAGRLGLDPFDVESWPPGIAEWFESASPEELDSALVVDLMEAPDAERSMMAQHQALRGVVRECGIGTVAATTAAPGDVQTKHASAHLEGYALAGRIRGELRLADDQRLKNVNEASEVACQRALLVHETARISEGRVQAVVGWRPTLSPVLAVRSTSRLEAARFLCARGVYLAQRAKSLGPRLVTDGKSWDQRASRAFGAELLAPRAGVRRLFEEQVRQAGRDEVGSYEAEGVVAQHYGVSPMIIRHQLENSRETLAGWM